MKRTISLLLAFLLVFGMLAGCGSEKAPAADAPGTEELEPVHLTWYFIGDGAVADSDVVNEAISEYVKEKINATVEIICYDWSSYDQKVANMIATGEPIDIVFTTTWALNYQSNAVKGSFLPVDDLLEQYGQGIIENLGMAPIDGNRIQGVAYGIPVNKEKAHSYGLMLNKKYVDKYNFDLSKVHSLDDLEPIFRTIKTEEIDKGNSELLANLAAGTDMVTAPTLLLNLNVLTEDSYLPGALWSNNDPSNTKVFNQFATPEFKEMLQRIRGYYEEGLIAEDATIMENEILAAQGLTFSKWCQLKPGGDKESSNAIVEWVQVELTDPVMSTGDINNSMVAISSTCENPERAMMLLNLMYTDKYLLDLVNYGIEGVHYDRIDENTVEPRADSKYYPGGSIAWEFGTQLLMSLKSNEDPNKWENFKKFNEEAMVLNSLGFVFDPSNVQTELSALSNVTHEYLPALVTGTVAPEEYYDEFLQKLDEAGVDKFIAEIQRQYDEFLANKK